MTEKELYEKLSYKSKNVYYELSADENKKMFEFCDDYKNFLDIAKTERECVTEIEKTAIENGFVKLDDKEELKAGDKVYAINREKNILLAVIGENDVEKGFNIVASHIDAPRLDLKPNPLYESEEMALLKTHYYGGIKKYQWTAIPLALHGVVFTKEGEKVSVSIGEKDTDPVFTITDLLPHLAQEQMQKKMSEGVEGESLNILVGGMGVNCEDVSEKVKYKILNILNVLYGIHEEDFLRAELEIVPSFKARNVGLDESFIGAYGQDDRVCAYTSLKGILDCKEPYNTAICFFVDKEEIGSVGNTGMLSKYFEMTVAEIVTKIKGEYNALTINKVISNSSFLSSDVGAALDPNYASCYEKNNAALAGHGIILMKYTGARGKSGASDASCEFVNQITSTFDRENVIWQTAELGKVDHGGGGTIAMYIGNMNMNVIDCGVPVLSMHAPFEVTAKGDVYMAYKAYLAFYNN